MQIKRSFFLFVWLLSLGSLPAQVVSLSGIINHYAAVHDIDTCSGRILVSDTTGFSPGMAVLLIQMQGAAIVNDNVAAYGTIQHLNAAGLFEKGLIDSVRTGALYLHDRPVNTYNLSGQLQVVSFPAYSHAVVTDTLRPKPWDGLTGGVLALEVTDTLAFEAPVSADGAGFRGGIPFFPSTNNCNFLIPELAYYYAAGNWRGSYKGEGVAQPETGKELGRGPQASGGGGGNDHNSGGGGGGQVGNGGRGGQNNEPTTLGCHGNFPGMGGRTLPPIIGRLFLGGGGGAGHANNGLTSGGGNGGGIIVLRAGVITGSQPYLTTNGLDVPPADGDGGGGGGAGGAIWLDAGTAPADLVLQANGGRGADTKNNGQNRCFGPGGGGSGGFLSTNLPGINTPSGGLPGIITGSSNGCNGASGGAEAGGNGAIAPLYPLPQGIISNANPVVLAGPASTSICLGLNGLFTVQTNPGPWTYQWQVNTGTGWQNIGGGQGYFGFQTDSLIPVAVKISQNGHLFRCQISRPFCAQVTSYEASLTISLFPSAAFTYTGGAGGLLHFSSAGLPGILYTWNFGDGTPTVTGPNPDHQYTMNGTYTVTLIASGSCGSAVAQQIIPVVVTGTFAPDDPAGIRIYPNPAGASLTVDCAATGMTPLRIKVYGVNGVVWLEKTSVSGPVTVLSMDEYPAGPYLIQVQFATGSVARWVFHVK